MHPLSCHFSGRAIALLVLALALAGCESASRADAYIARAHDANASVYAPALLEKARRARDAGDFAEARKLAMEAKLTAEKNAGKAAAAAGEARGSAVDDANMAALHKRQHPGEPRMVLVPMPKGVEALPADDAYSLVAKGALLLDVRPDSELAPDPNAPPGTPLPVRIPNAIRAPRTVLKDARYPPGSTFVVVGGAYESAEAAGILVERGYDASRIIVVDAGVDGWREKGLPVDHVVAGAGLPGQRIQTVLPEQLEQLQQAGAVVVDARTADLYSAGHVPGARNIAEPVLAASVAAVPAAGVAVVYGIDDAESRRAAEALASAGHADVRWLSGGFIGWATGGAKIATAAAATAPTVTGTVSRVSKRENAEVAQ